METDVMIRELKYKANKHKNDRLDTFTTDITAMCNDVIPKLELLKSYEDIGLTPEQLLEIDKMYSEKCREVAEFRERLSEKPTAYDVDKVIKQLEYKRSEYENRINIRNGACYYDETERIRTLSDRLYGFEQALEIVKEGETDEID